MKHNLSISCFDDFVKVVYELLPAGEHKLPPNLYECKKLLGALGLPYEKTDVCKNNCMLFRKEHEKKDRCDICGKCRYFEHGDEPEGRGHGQQKKSFVTYQLLSGSNACLCLRNQVDIHNCVKKEFDR